jgi:transglutaminase-like putative cysteine protease
MVYRYSWLAGVAAIALAFWRLSRLLEPAGGMPWQVVVTAALVVGGVVTWAGLAYRLKAGWIALVNLILFVIAAGRYIAPETGWWVLPNTETAGVLSAEIQRAGGLIRHGIEPVAPIPGLVLVLAGLFWVLGALLVFGLLRGRPYLGLIPPLVVGLQLMTIERAPSSNAEIAVYVLLVALTALAVGVDEHDRGAGRMSAPGQHPRRAAGPLSRTALALVAVTVLLSLGVSTAMASRIPTDGVLTWRAPGSLAAGLFGSISVDPFVDIHAGLVSRSETPYFTARITGEADSADVYFRLITLDTYNDEKWFASESDLVDAVPDAFGASDQPYAGPADTVTAAVRIEYLTEDYLPAPYAAVAVSGRDEDSFRVRTSDLSIHFAGNRTYGGMEYQVDAAVPRMDSGAVAIGPDGALSPLFSVAQEDGGTIPPPESDPTPHVLPDADLERYLQLPNSLDSKVRVRARELTSRLTTDFEKGLALEYWFRESGGFVYDLNVNDAEGYAPETLSNWLLDASEANAASYRRGYCKHFALSMGVMARAIGIPARVVIGFLPGASIGADAVVVRGTNLHAWVELWIPSQGWMKFDPTPRSDFGTSTYGDLNRRLDFDIAEYLDQVPERPGLTTSDGAPEEVAPPSVPVIPAPDLGFTSPGSSALAVLGAALAVLLLVAAVFLAGVPGAKRLRRRARIRRLSSGDITAAWDVIVAQLDDLDHLVDPSATPQETAAAVDTALQPLASVYTKVVYGPGHAATAAELDTAERSMTVTEERLLLDATPGARLRARYRLRSLLRGWQFSRWLPWLRR